MTLRKWCAAATCLLGLISGSVLRAATITQLTSASQLTPGVTYFTDPDPAGTVYSSSSVTLAAGELGLSRSGGALLGGAFEVDQVGIDYGSSAFSNGTKIIGAGGFQGSGNGGFITLGFSTPVYEFGLNVEEFNTGPYTVEFTVTNTLGASTFSASGNDPAALSFEGAVSAFPILSVTFDDSLAGGSNNLLLGNIAYSPINNGVGSEGPPAAPEPGTLLLLGGSLMGLALLRRKPLLNKSHDSRRIS